jgi:Ca2+-binding RTX toxin-like protein
MARGQFWDQVLLSEVSFTPLSDEASFWDNDNFTFLDILYEDILFNNGTFEGGIWEEYWMGSGISLDDQGQVVAGTLTGFVRWFQFTGETEWFYNIEINAFQISAIDFGEAVLSDDTADDQDLIREMLSGNDRFVLAEFDDEFFGWTGRDTLLGWRGDDTLSGDAGNDVLLGEGDDDILRGGTGNDRLVGGRGQDTLTGGTGNDTLDGGKGNDLLEGNGGADVFRFSTDSAQDRIRGWQDGIDRIAIEKGAETFDDLAITQSGGNALIAFGTVRITVVGTDAGSFSSADFDFL